jgi:hypothetical protein
MTDDARTRYNDRLRTCSGSVEDTRPLVCFLYLLCRDHLNVGDVETLMLEVSELKPGEVVKYTNGFLAKYAQDAANRLQ